MADKKKGFGLVQPPKAPASDYELYGDPGHGRSEVERAEFAAAVEGARPKTSADMPLVRIEREPSREEQWNSARDAIREEARAKDQKTWYESGGHPGGAGTPLPTNNDLNDMKDARELLQPKFTESWGPRAAEAVKSSPVASGAVKAVAQKLVAGAQWLQSREKMKPDAVSRYANERLRPTISEQDVELQALKDKNQRIQEAIDRAKAPQDIGDIDAPTAARQPIQMSREFPSTPQGKSDEAAYIQKARETARRASGK